MTCDKTAVALLTFSPPDAKAWLYDLDQPDPTGGIMLCRKHANATVVPMSWQLVDARDPAWPGPVGSTPALEAMMAATAEEIMAAPAASAPAPVDTTAADEAAMASSVERVFAMSAAPAPAATMQAEATVAAPTSAPAPAPMASTDADQLVDLGAPAPDASLFELPLSDIPAVTPYPR